MESTAKNYISNSYQGNLNFYRHKISYTLDGKWCSNPLFYFFLVSALYAAKDMLSITSMISLDKAYCPPLVLK
jgi:hypothetical protein